MQAPTLETVIGDAPQWGLERIEELREALLSRAAPFPCTFAVVAMKQGHLRFGFVKDIKDSRTWSDLPRILAEYLACYREIAPQTSLIIFFQKDEPVLSIEQYEAQFWSVLQFLHDNDPSPWPELMPRKISDPYWEFCFAGEPMFVVCNTPAHDKRASRKSPGVEITFQPRSVFDGIEAHTPRGQAARQKIRKRLDSYDEIDPYPTLGPYGDPNHLEWTQYFLPDNNEGNERKCPLSTER